MKTISKLFMPVLFLFGTALLAGCEDSKPPIDESEPENPTLFEYVLTVVDDTTGQPRAEESVTIKRTNKAGDVVHSSTDYTTCLLYTSPSPRDRSVSRMPSSA